MRTLDGRLAFLALVVTTLAACSSDGGGDGPADGDLLVDSSPSDGTLADSMGGDGGGIDGGADAPKSDGASDAALSCGDPEEMLPAWFRATPEKELYVAPGGDDTNDGSSMAKALKTTTAALKKLAPGVRLNFAAGTYGCGSISDFAGTAAKPG